MIHTASGFVSPSRLRRFHREAEIVSHLNHPGICAVYEADEHDGTPYISMQFIEGETLSQYIKGAKAHANQQSATTERSNASATETPHILGVGWKRPAEAKLAVRANNP